MIENRPIWWSNGLKFGWFFVFNALPLSIWIDMNDRHKINSFWHLSSLNKIENNMPSWNHILDNSPYSFFKLNNFIFMLFPYCQLMANWPISGILVIFNSFLGKVGSSMTSGLIWSSSFSLDISLFTKNIIKNMILYKKYHWIGEIINWILLFTLKSLERLFLVFLK